jgi:hypothetical protein
MFMNNVLSEESEGTLCGSKSGFLYFFFFFVESIPQRCPNDSLFSSSSSTLPFDFLTHEMKIPISSFFFSEKKEKENQQLKENWLKEEKTLLEKLLFNFIEKGALRSSSSNSNAVVRNKAIDEPHTNRKDASMMIF